MQLHTKPGNQAGSSVRSQPGTQILVHGVLTVVTPELEGLWKSELVI